VRAGFQDASKTLSRLTKTFEVMDRTVGKTDGAAVEAVFHAALTLSPAERERYLSTACGDDVLLRRRVGALLRAHEAPDGFLPERSSARSVLDALPGPTQGLRASEEPGDKIGRYKLLQNIGEGGCGVVYMAEQEEPVRRRVALKVIKLGMDTKQVVARFEAERQALALMDHANIAKVLDAGATKTGRPFFVMELVRGIKITDYCDQNCLSTPQRLDLFVQVCRAIEHAHQKGVIHRDIKPSNVLVTLHDGVPVPKVIDFGIAKAAQGRLTDQTMFTAFEQFIGTPAYMSPEQAEMSGLDIDTRSDIYSLGVLLYELLTGKTPFDANQLAASGLDAMRHTIREKQPTRPSAMLSTLLAGELAQVAKHRRVEVSKLISSIRGDVEWIAMKCLDKDRTRRYDTASGLAADIQRYLKNEPVVARPPSRVYLFQKLVHRHKLLFASAGAVAAAVLVGLGLSTWSWIQERQAHRRATFAERAQEVLRRQAEHAKQRAETNAIQASLEARKSKQVAQFLKDMLNGIGPSVALGRDTVVLREILSNTVQRVGHDLQNQPDVEAELRTTIGFVYLELADFDKAEAMLRRALALRETVSTPDNIAVAQAYSDLSNALWQQGKPGEAESAQRRALQIRERLLGKDDLEVAHSLHALGQVLVGQGRLGEAEGSYRRALEIRKRQLGDDNVEVAESLADVADVLSNQGQWDKAEAMYREALTIDRKLLTDEHPTVANVLHSLARLLLSHDKNLEAEGTAREAMRIRIKVLGEAHPLVAEARTTLARALESEEKFAEAESHARQALAVQKTWLASEHPGVADTLGLLVEILLPQHREAELEQIFNDLPTRPDATGRQTAEVIATRGNFFAGIGRWQEAAADFTKLIEFHPNDPENYHFLAPLLVQIGDIERYRGLCAQIRARFGGITNDVLIADRMAKDCLILPSPGSDRTIESRLANLAVTLGRGYPGEPWFQLCKGLAEYRQEHFATAIEWVRKVLRRGPDNPNRAVEAYMVLAMASQQLNQTSAANEALAKGLEVSRKHPPDFSTGLHGWIDWIIAQALTSEAQGLITGARPADSAAP